MNRFWIVQTESGKCYGPFTSADRASKWATKNIQVSHWAIVRLRRA